VADLIRALVLLLLVLATAGCAGEATTRAPQDEAEFFPSWLSEQYVDGTISIRYPKGWIENETKRFGHVLSDNKSFTAAFVGIQYLPRREWKTHGDFGQLAIRILRPPDGRGTTIHYTQAAKLGERHGVEAAVIWATDERRPLGPTMRVFGIELPSGKVAVVIFAGENRSAHALRFAWIKKSIAWR
jgi:hypothetical protein